MSVCKSLIAKFGGFKLAVRTPQINQFHSSGGAIRGWEEFKDPVEKDLTVTTGRAWTNADLRRKDFNDIHKLWYVLYKERNLLLTARNKARTNGRQTTDLEEQRYMNVKRSMAAIKHTLDERRKITALLKKEADAAAEAAAKAEEEASKALQG